MSLEKEYKASVISKTLVEIHGGEITAENNPDGGTTVRFTVKEAQEGSQSA